jgi:hypothetical protein
MVLGFACLWFGMLVPVHQRGMIQLPGPAVAAAASAAQASHCPRAGDVKAPCHKAAAKEGDGEAPASEGNCAVCHFVLGLHVPPPVTVYVACLGLLRQAAPEEPAIAPLRHAALPFHGLDPPTV